MPPNAMTSKQKTHRQQQMSLMTVSGPMSSLQIASGLYEKFKRPEGGGKYGSVFGSVRP